MLFGKTKQTEPQSNDVQLLKQAMRKIIDGDFHEVATDEFQDKELPELLSQTIMSFKRFNNNFIMRQNEAMEAIGDQSYVKNLLDQVSSQTKDIEAMELSSQNLEQSIEHISNYMREIRDSIQEMLATTQNSTANMTESISVVNTSSEKISEINQQIQAFRSKIDEIGNIVDVVRDVASQSNLLALNASIEAARAGEAGRGFAVVAEQVRQLSTNTTESAGDISKYVQELQQDILTLASSMAETTKSLSEGNAKVEVSLSHIERLNAQMTQINESANIIFDDIGKQSNITRDFSVQIEGFAKNQTELSEFCHKTGIHIFKIGRYIDTCRSDMYREAGCATTQDKLTVFEIDHFILMWRLYGHAMGFEQLKLTQLNNPDKCKLGLWMAEQTDPKITNSSHFKNLYKAHHLVHQYAVDSWHAKDRGDVEGALAYFQKCYDAYYEYRKCINSLKDYMYELGYTEKTQIVVYRK